MRNEVKKELKTVGNYSKKVINNVTKKRIGDIKNAAVDAIDCAETTLEKGIIPVSVETPKEAIKEKID